jgi:hypothetical protein
LSIKVITLHTGRYGVDNFWLIFYSQLHTSFRSNAIPILRSIFSRKPTDICFEKLPKVQHHKICHYTYSESVCFWALAHNQFPTNHFLNYSAVDQETFQTHVY